MIAYDTNILIYALEGTSPWAAVAQAVVRQGEQDGAVLSVLVWQELMTGAVLQDGGLDGKLAAVFCEFRATKFMPVSQAVCERAVALTKHYGKRLYGYNAIHLATALEYKVKTFVTNDKTLLNLQVNELDIKGL